jgi:hypothetical protein
MKFWNEGLGLGFDKAVRDGHVMSPCLPLNVFRAVPVGDIEASRHLPRLVRAIQAALFEPYKEQASWMRERYESRIHHSALLI